MNAMKGKDGTMAGFIEVPVTIAAIWLFIAALRTVYWLAFD
jgi:hypothetical protein